MPLVVLVPGYRGRLRAVERWRVNVALATLADHGGGELVVSGHGGEAERLAALVPAGIAVVVEPTASSTFENIARSLPFLGEADRIAVASDRWHVRRATRYLQQLDPDLAERLVRPKRVWWRGWWMDAGGAVYEALLATRRFGRILARKTAFGRTAGPSIGRDRRELSAATGQLAGVTKPSDAQAHITAFWSTVADGYEAHGGNVAKYGSREYRAWVDALASVLPDSPSDVLDVAAGTGYLALAAASLGHRVTAIDLAPAMLQELRASATTRGLDIDVRLGDAVAPEFPAESFDAVTSRHLLWTLRDPASAMTNWRQLLRPGGRLVAIDGFWFTEWNGDNAPPLFREHYTPQTRAQLPFMHLNGPEPILTTLSAAGFVDADAVPRPDLDVGAGVPYVFSATVA